MQTEKPTVVKSISWYKLTDEERKDARPTESCLPVLVRIDTVVMTPRSSVAIPDTEMHVVYEVGGDGSLYDAAGDPIGWDWDSVTWVGVIESPVT